MAPKPPLDWFHSRSTWARVLDGADRADAGLVDEVDHLLDVAALDRHLGERGGLLEVAEPRLDAELDLLVGLLAGLGDVHEPTSRHAARETVLPWAFARSSTTFQWWASASKPSLVRVAPIESRPIPCVPAMRGPVGEATARRRCRSRAGCRPQVQAGVDQVVGLRLPGDRLAAQQPHDDVEVDLEQLAGVGRVEAQHHRVGGQRSRPAAQHGPALVRWSSITMRSATHSGLWYAIEVTPVPSLMCLVRSAAVAMKISGEAMISLPAEWCSLDPRLVVAQPVEVLDEFHVPLQGQGRVLSPRGVAGPGRCRTAVGP